MRRNIRESGYWLLVAGCQGLVNEVRIIMRNGGYKNLEIYRLSHNIGVAVHHFSFYLPKYELYETASQLRRASMSISVNIVEGYGRRRYKADHIRFLIYTQASCDETAEWLEYIKDCHPKLDEKTSELLNKLDELGRKINRFITAIERNNR